MTKHCFFVSLGFVLPIYLSFEYMLQIKRKSKKIYWRFNIVSCLHLPNSDPVTHYPKYPMNPTTDSQALLTKIFLYFIPFFFFFCFLPCQLSLPNSNFTPLFPIPYYYVHLPVNNLYSLYLLFYFFYLYNAIMQGSKSHTVTVSQTHKAKNPKQKKKHKQFRISSDFSGSAAQHKHQIS